MNRNTKVLIILNNSEKGFEAFDLKPYNEIIGSYRKGREVLSGDYLDQLSTVPLPAKTPLIIDLMR